MANALPDWMEGAKVIEGDLSADASKRWSHLRHIVAAWWVGLSLNRGPRLSIDYPADQQSEEAIAFGIEFLDLRQPQYSGPVNRIMRKIYAFFERLWNALLGRGYQSVEDVVARFQSGEIGSREPAEALERLRLARLAKQFEFPDAQRDSLYSVGSQDLADIRAAFSAAKISQQVRDTANELRGQPPRTEARVEVEEPNVDPKDLNFLKRFLFKPTGISCWPKGLRISRRKPYSLGEAAQDTRNETLGIPVPIDEAA